MGYLFVIGLTLLIAMMFSIRLLLSCKKLIGTPHTTNQVSNLKVQLMLDGSKSKVAGMTIIILGLVTLLIGNLKIDGFTIKHLMPNVDFSFGQYIITVLLVIAACMLLNTQKITQLMNEAEKDTANIPAPLYKKITLHEKLNNFFFIGFCMTLTIQFMINGFSFL